VAVALHQRGVGAEVQALSWEIKKEGVINDFSEGSQIAQKAQIFTVPQRSASRRVTLATEGTQEMKEIKEMGTQMTQIAL